MNRPGNLLRVALVLAWVFGILIPLYSFRRFSTSYQAAFDWVFHTHASHVLMHTFLYGVLGCLLCSLAARSTLSAGRQFVLVLFGVAIVGVLQEAIQTRSEHVVLGRHEVFDLFVDLNGGLLGTLLFMRTARQKRKSTDQVEPVHAGDVVGPTA